MLHYDRMQAAYGRMQTADDRKRATYDRITVACSLRTIVIRSYVYFRAILRAACMQAAYDRITMVIRIIRWY